MREDQVGSASELAREFVDAWSVVMAGTTVARAPIARLDGEVARTHPRLCLAAIVDVLALLGSDGAHQLRAVLAAGPLESLLVHRGDLVIDEVERLARQDPGFRALLRGVWFGGIDARVRDRLAKYLGGT